MTDQEDTEVQQEGWTRQEILAAIDNGTSDEARGVRALRRFMCCQAGREMVDVGLIRPFLHSLPYVPEAAIQDAQARIADLERALRDVRFHTGRGDSEDGTILEIRETVDAALSNHEGREGSETCKTCGGLRTIGTEPCPDCWDSPPVSGGGGVGEADSCFPDPRQIRQLEGDGVRSRLKAALADAGWSVTDTSVRNLLELVTNVATEDAIHKGKGGDDG